MLKTPLLWGTLRSFIYLGLFLPTALVAQRTALTMPMVARYEDGAEYRWLHKKVLDSRLLDDTENLSSWSFAGAGEMTLVEVRASEPWTMPDSTAPNHVLRIRSTSNIAQVDGSGEWEDLVATGNSPAKTGANTTAFHCGSTRMSSEHRRSPALRCCITMASTNCPITKRRTPRVHHSQEPYVESDCLGDRSSRPRSRHRA